MIVREYDSAEKASPDKAPTPPKDNTGHIQSVQASTPSMTVDSSVNPDHSIMKKINRDLVKVSADSAPVQNSAQKKQEDEDVD